MKPKVVCLCGSTKFKEAFENANMRESLDGKVVLSAGCSNHHNYLNLGEKQQKELDDLHKKKIDMADEIYVLNVKGYIGEATKNYILYAKDIGKLIRYLEDPEWYGDGTEEALGEVEFAKEEIDELNKTMLKEFDKDKLKSKFFCLIGNLQNAINEKNKISVRIINILLKKLTEFAENQYKEFNVNSTWTSYFETSEIRLISDYINDATSLLSNDSFWSTEY